MTPCTAPARAPQPRVFSEAAIADADLRGVLEAARWAPSCFNDQPWAFVVARREDAATFDALLGCLTPSNQAWAADAPVLLLSVARTRFRHNDKPNRHAWHDVGLATAQLALEAQARGLAVHMMAGFDVAAAAQAFGLPDGHEPVAAIALGHQRADLAGLPADVVAREQGPAARAPGRLRLRGPLRRGPRAARRGAVAAGPRLLVRPPGRPRRGAPAKEAAGSASTQPSMPKS
ncbi:MAG: nitroreductase family protein [bacterium]